MFLNDKSFIYNNLLKKYLYSKLTKIDKYHNVNQRDKVDISITLALDK